MKSGGRNDTVDTHRTHEAAREGQMLSGGGYSRVLYFTRWPVAPQAQKPEANLYCSHNSCMLCMCVIVWYWYLVRLGLLMISDSELTESVLRRCVSCCFFCRRFLLPPPFSRPITTQTPKGGTSAWDMGDRDHRPQNPQTNLNPLRTASTSLEGETIF